MFKIESYITPIIINYIDKYVKDFRPQNAQVREICAMRIVSAFDRLNSFLGFAMGRWGGLSASGHSAGCFAAGIAFTTEYRFGAHSWVDSSRAMDENRIGTNTNKCQHNRFVPICANGDT